jgi:hypothetical protein
MLPQQGFASRSDESPQDKRDEEHIVQLARDRNEVRDEVEREREISEQRQEEQLPPSRHAPIGYEPAEQHQAVRDEACEGTRLLAATDEKQEPDEHDPSDDGRRDGRERPQPPAHDPKSLGERDLDGDAGGERLVDDAVALRQANERRQLILAG